MEKTTKVFLWLLIFMHDNFFVHLIIEPIHMKVRRPRFLEKLWTKNQFRPCKLFPNSIALEQKFNPPLWKQLQDNALSVIWNELILYITNVRTKKREKTFSKMKILCYKIEFSRLDIICQWNIDFFMWKNPDNV